MISGTLILAAGLSRRIEPIAQGLPKPLLHFGGRSLIEWNLKWLRSGGLDATWINLHHGASRIREALGASHAGVTIRYSHEETLLGTAGAWRALRDEWVGPSLVVYGDNVMRFDLRSLMEAHRRGGGLATIAVFDPFTHMNTGIAGGHVELAADGRVVAFREGVAPRPGRGEYVNAGAYVLEPEVAERIGPGMQDFGRDVFPRLVEEGRLHGHRIEREGFCLGLDTPECFHEAERLLAAGKVVLE